MSEKNRTKKELILVDSCYGLIASAAVGALVPEWFLLKLALNAVSVLGISFVAFTHSKYDLLFKNLELQKGQATPILKYKEKKECSTIYHFTLPAGLSLTNFREKQEAIENYVGKKVIIKYENKEITIEEFKNDVCKFVKYEVTELPGKLPLMIGKDIKGEWIKCDLGDGDPHILIAGTTGSGKSTLLRSLITNLIETTNAELHLIDLKNGVELGIFEDCKTVLTFSKNVNEAYIVLSEVVSEINDRYEKMRKVGVSDIDGYNKCNRNKMKRQVVIIDEYADISRSDECRLLVETCTQKARACGIHFVISTQRPSAKILNGEIKANVSAVIGLKTNDNTNSRIIISDSSIHLERLRGKGHGVMFKNGELWEIQAPKLDVKDAMKLIEHTKIHKDKRIKKESVETIKEGGDLFE